MGGGPRLRGQPGGQPRRCGAAAAARLRTGARPGTADRRHTLALLGAAAAGLMLGGAGEPPAPFVRRDGLALRRGDAPYRIVGANLWYAAWLGADADYGDRARLGRELDRLRALGVGNLRIMASAEEEIGRAHV